jgi:hypothetical protein
MTGIRKTGIDGCPVATRALAPVPIVLAITLSLTACSLVGAPTALTEQVSTARTPEQHIAVAGRYREYAAHLRAEAARHADLAALWSRGELVGSEVRAQGQEGRHCHELAEYLSRAAAEAEAIAQDQEASGKGNRK